MGGLFNVLSAGQVNGKDYRIVSVSDVQGALEILKARNWVGCTVIRAYKDEQEYVSYNLVGDQVMQMTFSRSPRTMMPEKDQAIIFFPEAAGRVPKKAKHTKSAEKSAAKPTKYDQPTKPVVKALWEVAILVQGSQWTMLAKNQGREHAKKGTVEKGTSSQHTYLRAVYNALSGLKEGKTSRVVLSVGDKNVSRMLKGEMNSRKNAEPLRLCRELVQKLAVEVVSP
jgi:hypothetical protein